MAVFVLRLKMFLHVLCLHLTLFICWSVDRFCHRGTITTVQDAVTKHYRCVDEIKVKVDFENGCGPSKSTGSKGVGSGDFTAQFAAAADVIPSQDSFQMCMFFLQRRIYTMNCII